MASLYPSTIDLKTTAVRSIEISPMLKEILDSLLFFELNRLACGLLHLQPNAYLSVLSLTIDNDKVPLPLYRGRIAKVFTYYELQKGFFLLI
jgi:hypothetical protein